MKKYIRGILTFFITAILMLSSTSINFASSIPTPNGNDITDIINISTDLFSFYDRTYGKEITVIEDNIVMLDDIDLEYKEAIKLEYSWKIDDSEPVIKEGDYFKITLPRQLTINCFVSENGFLPIYNGIDNTLIGYWRIASEVVDGTTKAYIEFIAHSNFSAVIADREGYFNLDGFVTYTNSVSEEAILTFPDINIDATIKNPEYIPPRHEQEGYGAGMARPNQMPNIAKNAAGKLSPSSPGEATGLWTVRFGYDDYLNTSHLRQGDTFEAHENVVIRDEIEQDGHVFTNMSIRLPYFTPHNAEGVTGAYWTASWTPSMAALGIDRYYDTDYSSVEEWESALSAPENAPAYGISSDGKIAIINLGNILDNGVKYAPDNAALETILRKSKGLTNEEVKTIIQSIGENTPSYTLTEYDGTKDTIAIESFIDNRAICYMINFHSSMDVIPGREYSNEITLSYDGNVEEEASSNRFLVASSDGGASGTPTGILYLYKYDENGYTTATEQEITDAQFDLYQIIDGKEEFISSKVTDNLGSVLFENMPVGRYRIYEKSSADGYITSTLKLYKRQPNGTHVLYSSDTLNDNWFEIEVTEEDRYFYFEGTNRKSEGTELSIIKQDSVNPTIILEGASFTLTNGSDVYFSEFDPTNGKYVFPLLPLGKYTLEETVTPIGYQEDSLRGVDDVDDTMEGIQISIVDDTDIELVLTNELISADAPISDEINKETNIPDTGDDSLLVIYVLGIILGIFSLLKTNLKNKAKN